MSSSTSFLSSEAVSNAGEEGSKRRSRESNLNNCKWEDLTVSKCYVNIMSEKLLSGVPEDQS
jgi:hypothetical protein